MSLQDKPGLVDRRRHTLHARSSSRGAKWVIAQQPGCPAWAETEDPAADALRSGIPKFEVRDVTSTVMEIPAPSWASCSSPTAAAEPAVIQHHSVYDEVIEYGDGATKPVIVCSDRVSPHAGAGDLRRRDVVSTARPTGPRRVSAAESPEISRSAVHDLRYVRWRSAPGRLAGIEKRETRMPKPEEPGEMSEMV